METINNGLAEVCEDLAKYNKTTKQQKKKFLQYARIFRGLNNVPNKSKQEVKMGKRLTPEEKRIRRVNKALESIRKLEKTYEQDVLKSACNKYSILLRDKKNALREKKELEERLEKLKGRI